MDLQKFQGDKDAAFLLPIAYGQHSGLLID